jgi:hypothetical protein
MRETVGNTCVCILLNDTKPKCYRRLPSSLWIVSRSTGRDGLLVHREKKKGDTTLPDSSSSLLISLLIFQWGKQNKKVSRVDRSGVHSKYQGIVFPTATAGNASIHPSTPSSIGLHLKRLCPHEVTLFDMSIFYLGFQISGF